MHTRRPWTTDRMAQTVRAENGQMTVCDIRGWGFLTGEGGLHLSEDHAIEVQRANARLMAAAPDYFDAAENLSTDYSELDGDDAGYVAVPKDAFDALMKAHRAAAGA